MSETTLAPDHLEEGELVRLLDGEGEPDEKRRWAAHVDGCERCAAGLGSVGRRLRGVSAELERVQLPADFRYPALPERTAEPRPVREGARVPGWVRAAAAVAVLAAGVWTVPPLRAWVAERWAAVATGADGEAVQASAEAAPLRFWFAPVGETLEVDVTARQAAGTLTVRRATQEQGLLEVHAAGAAGTPQLSERRVRIVTAPGHTGSYTVHLPESVATVVVRVAGGEARTLDATDLARPVVLPLSGNR